MCCYTRTYPSNSSISQKYNHYQLREFHENTKLETMCYVVWMGTRFILYLYLIDYRNVSLYKCYMILHFMQLHVCTVFVELVKTKLVFHHFGWWNSVCNRLYLVYTCRPIYTTCIRFNHLRTTTCMLLRHPSPNTKTHVVSDWKCDQRNIGWCVLSLCVHQLCSFVSITRPFSNLPLITSRLQSFCRLIRFSHRAHSLGRNRQNYNHQK